MNKSEVADLLTVIAAFDRRTLGEPDVEAWHLILAGLPLDDCAQAVKDHYTQSAVWLMPAHVVERATVLQRQRLGRQRVAELEAERDREDRAIEAGPRVDRDVVAARLKAMAATGRSAPRVDRRVPDTRRSEARAELDAIRVAAPTAQAGKDER